MNCPQCQTTNPDTAKFCINCATSLVPTALVTTFVCANCNTALPPQAKFCFNCGHPQTHKRSKTDPAQKLIQKYTTPDYIAKVEAAQAEPQSERRVVTILFCDVKGSTAMAEKLDPEEWAEIMNTVFEHLIEPVYRYEGTVVRLLGDAILAFFGAPVAHEDDPQRAVLAGLAITEGIQTYRQKVKQERDLDFDVRVGINTGLVVVGEIGSDLRAEYTIMGDAVNLAARMEQTAQPGTVHISEHTYKFIEPLFNFADLGPIEVKGKSEPLNTYRPLSLKVEPGRVRGIAGLNTPLVGRETEFKILRQILVNLKQGQGQIVSLIGEAGLGKSRLIREVQAEWKKLHASETGPLPWNQSQAVSYESQAYSQFQQLLRRACEISDYDTPDQARQKITEHVLKMAPPELANRVVRAMELMLGIDESSSNGNGLEGEVLKQELFDVMGQIFSYIGNTQPMVVVFDDLHWADSASVELLIHLLRTAINTPLLFLCVYRPVQQTPAWQIKQMATAQYMSYYTEIELHPLSSEASNHLVDQLLTVADLPVELRTLIGEKSDGNPFFVEEVVRTLIDSHVVEQTPDGNHWRAIKNITDISIPNNVQALLAARIDQLPDLARHTLQRAAIIGRTFSRQVLEMISPEITQLDQHLALFQEMGLVVDISSQGDESVYMFRHALTREAAYNNILLKRRRELHQRTGDALESLYEGHLEDYASLLGHHFYEAGNDSCAQHYYMHAGDVAYHLYANDNAVDAYSKAIEIARRNLTDEGLAGPDILAYLYGNRGQALEWAGQYDESLANYEEMLGVGADQEAQSVVLKALVGLVHLYSSFLSPIVDTAKGELLAQQALELAQTLGDKISEVQILRSRMLQAVTTEQVDLAASYGQQALTLAREANLSEQLAYTLTEIQFTYLMTDQVDQVEAALLEAQALWRKLDNKLMLVDNFSRLNFANFLTGRYQDVLDTSAESYQISQTAGYLWGQSFSQILLSYIYLDYGQPGKALQTLDNIVKITDRIGLIFPRVSAWVDQGWVLGTLGALDEAFEAVEVGLSLLKGITNLPPGVRGWGLINRARLYILTNQLTEAETDLAEAEADMQNVGRSAFAPLLLMIVKAELALARQNYEQVEALVDSFLPTGAVDEVLAFWPDMLLVKGQALLAQNHYEPAKVVLQETQTIAQKLDSRRILWPTLVALSQIEQQQGNVSSAQALQQQATDIINYIAEHIDDSQLRSSFLNQPSAQAMFNQLKSIDPPSYLPYN